MKAFIYTGGAVYPDNITERPKSDDLRIAADSGYKNAEALGERVDILVGDFDSLGDGVKNIPESVEKITVPKEKDETDTQLAVNIALSKGADDIVIIGGLDGRIDHALSNMAILEAMHESKVHCVITNGANRVRFIKSGSTLIARSGFDYLSLIAADEVVKGVSIEGCKYPLSNARLSRKFHYAVSNEIIQNCALISVKRGGLFIIESRDVKRYF
ncbi:MAG: thiamine diphosphokinase [Clostridia bacterium]|nr:thiamine diphosphokinase [Clostridia bacterium]